MRKATTRLDGALDGPQEVPMRAHWLWLTWTLGCGDPITVGGEDFGTTEAWFDASSSAFWGSPFPGDHRVRSDTRRPDVSGFPNPDEVPLVDQLVSLVDDANQGWSSSSAIYLPLSGPVRTDALPDRAESVEEGSQVFLMEVDDSSPTVGRRIPIDVVYRGSDSAYGPAHAIAALPVPGVTLRPRTRYLLAVLRPMTGGDGLAVARPEVVEALIDNQAPEGWSEDVANQYLDALRIMTLQGVNRRDLLTLTVFTTANPTQEFLDLASLYDGLCSAAFTVNRCPIRYAGAEGTTDPFIVEESTDDFCVYEARMTSLVYQEGEPPYASGEGGWIWDEDNDGLLERQRQETGRLFITVPTTARPGDKLPAVVFIRTGGGGDRPLLDRGIRTEAGRDDGTLQGFAQEFARAGWIGVMVDGPLGGLRNTGDWDEQFQIFDVDNPVALRDNLRQSALELAMLPHSLDGLQIPPRLCSGIDAGTSVNPPRIQIDTDQIALFGHSMGATIAPLVAAAQPMYKHLILSGAGAGWIDNIVYKERPIPTAPLAAALLREPDESAIDRHHPVLSLLQWAGEPAEPFLYAPLFRRGGPGANRRDVLMVQGSVDRYILPPMANAMSLSLGLDAAGRLYDAEDTPEHPSLRSVLPFIGGRVLDLPAGANQTAAGLDRTAVVIQHREDDVEGGHEVAYQKPIARWQIGCFLQTLREDGVGVVGESGVADSPCPRPRDVAPLPE